MIVRQLTDLSEEIDEALAGHSNEFVLRKMNWAIVTAIHAYAKSYPRHTLKLDLKNLPRSAIRAKFESDMQHCLGLQPDEQYASVDELAMVIGYFAGAGK